MIRDDDWSPGPVGGGRGEGVGELHETPQGSIIKADFAGGPLSYLLPPPTGQN